MKLYFAAVVCLLLCACEQRSTSARLDACDLLTKEDAKEALGAEPKAPRVTNTGEGDQYMSQCLYSAQGSGGFGTVSVLLRHSTADSADPDAALKSFVESVNKEIGEAAAGMEPLLDLSVPALWTPKLGQVTFFVPHRMVIVSSHQGGEQKATAIALAKKVLAKPALK